MTGRRLPAECLGRSPECGPDCRPDVEPPERIESWAATRRRLNLCPHGFHRAVGCSRCPGITEIRADQ